MPFLEIDVPDDIAVYDADLDSDVERTRQIGEDWLNSGATALLRVPTVLVPATFNILINPAHEQASRIRVLRTHHHPFDPRLLKTATSIK